MSNEIIYHGGFISFREIWKIIFIGLVTASISLGSPLKQTNQNAARSITLKLGEKHQIDIPQEYFNSLRRKVQTGQEIDWFYMSVMYPHFDVFSLSNEYINTSGYQDNNVLNIVIYPFPPFRNTNELRERKAYGQEGVKGILEVEKNFEPTPVTQQPFSNPTEYTTDKAKVFFYIFDFGDHIVPISCYSESVRNKFHPFRCSAKKLLHNSVGISYDFGIHNVQNFGQIEKGIEQIIQKLNIREIKH